MLTVMAIAMSLTVAQAKVEIIRGKPGTGVVRENAPQTVAPSQQQSCSACEAQQRQLDARAAELQAREKALEEKQAQAAADEEKKADEQRRLQEQIEKIGANNRRAWRNAANALSP